MSLAAAFQSLGFSENEMKAYLGLAELGKSTAQLLAKKIGIPRTTAYSVLETLTKKGVVYQEQRKQTTFYAPNNPESLSRMLEEEKADLRKKEDTAAQLIEAVRPYFKSTSYSVPKVQFFEGKAGVNTMLYEWYLKWQASMAKYDCTWWGYQDHTFVEQYMDWLEWHWERRLPEETICLFSNQAPIETELAGSVERRFIRPVPKGIDFSSTIWVSGDYIMLLMTQHEPQYAYQLNDSVFAANLRSVFQMLWQGSG